MDNRHPDCEQPPAARAFRYLTATTGRVWTDWMRAGSGQLDPLELADAALAVVDVAQLPPYLATLPIDELRERFAGIFRTRHAAAYGDEHEDGH